MGIWMTVKRISLRDRKNNEEMTDIVQEERKPGYQKDTEKLFRTCHEKWRTFEADNKRKFVKKTPRAGNELEKLERRTKLLRNEKKTTTQNGEKR